jgi:hypothetical protein
MQIQERRFGRHQHDMQRTGKKNLPLLVLWLVVAAVVIYLTSWPLLENVWASYTWDHVPCEIHDGIHYVYVYDGHRYIGSRKNFWDQEQTTAHETPGDRDLPPLDRTCYVQHGDPVMAVLNLDAPQHLEQGSLRFVNAGFILAVGIFLSVVIRRRRAAPQP